MGTLIGHVAPGLGFVLIGLWHLVNHIKLHVTHPSAYVAPPWFPAAMWRHLELYLIMSGSIGSIAMELFIGPRNHQPLDPLDGTIPANHLHNFEHASISLAFFAYAALALVLDRSTLEAQQRRGLTQLVGAVAFAQQLLLFRVHSADHLGPEGQYHLLLQLLVLVSLTTTLMGLGFPNSFHVSFVRSLAIFFQGVWLVLMGFMLWTPSFIAKGCFMHDEDSHAVVRCSSEESLHRAKSLVNLQFSWLFVLISVFGVCLYLALVKIYGQNYDHNRGKVEYFSLGVNEDQDHGDVESQKKSLTINHISGNSKSFINEMGKSGFVGPADMER